MYRTKFCTSAFLAGKFLFASSHFCCKMYRLATKRTEKTSRRKRKRNFFETDNQACPGRIHWLRELWSVTLEWIEFGCVRKLYPLNRIVRISRSSTYTTVPVGYTVRRTQYDRLFTQQLNVYEQKISEHYKIYICFANSLFSIAHSRTRTHAACDNDNFVRSSKIV